MKTYVARLSATLALLLAACGGGDLPPPSEAALVGLSRNHLMFVGRPEDAPEFPLDSDWVDGFGTLDKALDGGALVFTPRDLRDPERRTAYAKVYSSNDGRTYWVSAVAPSTTDPANGPIFTSSQLSEVHTWKKTAADARLQYVLTEILIEAGSGNTIDPAECPAATFPQPDWPRWCQAETAAGVEVAYVAGLPGHEHPFFSRGSTVLVQGWQGQWQLLTYELELDPTIPKLLYPANLDFIDDLDRDGGLHMRVKLKAPVRIDIPLDGLKVGEEFEVTAYVGAYALNEMQGESYYSAFVRDPAGGSGTEVIAVGLEPAPPHVPRRGWVPSAPVPPCAGEPDPTAGSVQFEQPLFNALEHGRAPVLVTRSGGGRGAVSVVVTSSDGTASAGRDYRPISKTVTFADGETGTKFVFVPIIGDTLVEEDETVLLSLGGLRGCATLGPQTSAVMTIVDDDASRLRFTVGGTVTGLVGSGLVVGNSGSSVTPTTDGPFTIATPLPNGTAYDVRVLTQPGNPIQRCTVQRGSGTIAGANITDVLVQCATPLPNGALDPTFGSAGKVTSSSLTSGVKAMALQGDGKIVLLSGARSIVRYRSDGSLDTGFGSNGVATVGFSNGSDTARALALQADGKILVAGRAVGSSFDDFGVMRLNADGSVDTGFGALGKVLVDVNGGSDEAQAVLVQDDGRIVVAGNANTATPAGADSDFAAVRLLVDGALDTSFGLAGKVRVNVAGRADIAAAAALKPDGSIVIVGRVAVDGGALPDTGVVILGRDGSGVGVRRLDLIGGGEHDEAVDVVVQPDGRILLAIALRSGGLWRYVLARRQADGAVDPTFGTAGLGHIEFSFAVGGDFARALALMSDGRIVVAGITRPSATQTGEIDDFIVTRHRGDGTLDTSFGTDGRVAVDFFGSSDGAECVAVLPDGRIVAAGLARNATVNGSGLVRLLP